MKYLNRSFLKKILRKIYIVSTRPVHWLIAQREKIEDDKILLITQRGSYNCNPRAIADEIIRQNLPWKLVWVIRRENLKNIDQYPKQLKLVLRESWEYYLEAARAKVIIDNDMSYDYSEAYKKPGQIYCQTWHGSIGPKRFCTEDPEQQRWVRRLRHSGAMTDYCFSNSSFETELFRSTFWGDAQILETGHTRNDILLTDDTQRIARVRRNVLESLKVPEGVKIALYAPTFREDKKDLRPYAIDYETVREALSQRFGGEWVIVSRLHFEVKEALAGLGHAGAKPNTSAAGRSRYVIDATDYPDIQDILLVADAGITDYSGWVFEYVLTRRPAFLYATDLKEYYSERGFYYPLEDTPFSLAQDVAALVENILEFDDETYQKKVDRFLEDKGCIDDGHASERVVELLKEIIGM